MESIETLGALDLISKENTIFDSENNQISLYDAIVCAIVVQPLRIHVDTETGAEMRTFITKLKSRIFNMMKKEFNFSTQRTLDKIIKAVTPIKPQTRDTGSQSV